MEPKTYNLEDRLVEFAGKTILFCKTLPGDQTGAYYGNQILRSSGSAALHYGEAQGTTTPADFIHKMTNVLKEVRETRVSLRILDFVSYGESDQRKFLMHESYEICAISAKMILNKKRKGADSPSVKAPE